MNKSYVTPKELIENDLMLLTDIDKLFMFNLSTVDVGSGYTITLKGTTYFLKKVFESGGKTRVMEYYPYFQLHRINVDTIVEPAL